MDKKTSKNHRQRQRRRFLTISIATAIIVHIIALFTVNGMAFLSNIGSGPDKINDLVFKDPKTAEAMLKEALEPITVDPSAIIRHPSATSGNNPFTPASRFDASISLPDIFRELPNKTLETPPISNSFIINATDSLSNTNDNNDTTGDSIMAIDFGDTDTFTNDLIEATDVIQGLQQKNDTNSPLKQLTDHTIGQQQDIHLHNIATERHSGTLNTGTLAGAAYSKPTANSNSATTASNTSPLADLGDTTAATAGSVASSDDFDLDIRTTAAPEGGYLFQVRLVPKEGVKFLRIKQNVFFLLDRSHSINRQRYELSKNAIVKALHLLQNGDTFNILVFDNKIVKMAESTVPWSLEAIDEADTFLSNQYHGGMFASTDLYSSLDKIIPNQVAETEVNTAILLSDGDTLLTQGKQRSTINQWSKDNRGKVSLFSVASGNGNNLGLLDLLSTNNKGVLSYCMSHSQLGEALQDLLQRIQNPIGKDLVATVITPDTNSKITIYPRPRRLADLYEHIPYVLYGHTDKLSDFYIFLQGKYYDRWFDIKQLVSFKQARPGNEEQMIREWAMQLAYDCYDHYLSEGEQKNLLRAKQILQPFNIPVAFPR